MQKHNFISEQNINVEEHSSQLIGQYKIWLSTQPKHYGMYLTIKSHHIVIGSQSCDLKEDIILPAKDFIGYNLEEVRGQWTRISLNTFSKKKKLFREKKRYLIPYAIYIYREQFENKKLEELKCNLQYLASNKPVQKSTQTPKLMIYFNPNSGSNSKKHFEKILNFLSFTNFSYDIIQTERKNHCLQHINNELDFKLYHGIVIVSGDGLMHEFVNSKAAGIIPVTHVPAGSGNAFAKYQMTLADEACEDEQAIFLAIKGNIRKFNLVKFNLEHVPNPVYSFLSFEWCFMADIDMNSQFLRCLGGLRFEIYGLWRLLKVRKYKGKFSYSKTSTNLPNLNEEITDIENFITEQKTYLHQIITFIPWVSTSYEISPLLQIEDEAMDMQKMSEEAGKLQLTKYMLTCESGSHFDREKKKVQDGYKFQWDKIKSFRLEPNGQDVGVFGIDGQMYEAQKIQAKISDKKVLTFA